MTSILAQGPIFLVCLVFMLGVVVIIHELGHYLAGRFFGAAVESFSVGFGRSIWERTDKRGTRWRVNWIPLGGFVKFVGESQMANDVDVVEQGPIGKPYHEVGVGGRSIVSLAGPIANFILAIAIYALIFGFNGTYESRIQIADVRADFAAERAGLQAGDVFVSANGKEIRRTSDVTEAFMLTAGNRVDVTVLRDGETITTTVIPQNEVRDNGLGQMMPQATIGVAIQNVPDTARRIQLNPIEAVVMGTEQTGSVLKTTVTMMGRLVTGKEPVSTLSGPVAIGDTGRRIFNLTMANEQVPMRDRLMNLVWTMLGLCAAVSIGIGFFNLLPLPVLDGGHLVFNAYEAVTGKVMPEKVQILALKAGLGLLLTLFVFITWGDILETGLFNRSAG